LIFKKSINRCWIVLSLGSLMLAGSTGCQLFPDRPEWSTKLFGKDEEAVVPTRMMVMWADTILHQPQKAGVRGFGGRIYFYNEEGPDPVKVDGGLAVYAFDANDLNPKSAKPKRKYVFTADQFADHMSHTSMGTSYSVWCPWDEVGGYNQELSLIVRFEGRGGGVVISDPTVKLLPGLNRPPGAQASGLNEAANRTKGAIAQTAGTDTDGPSTRLAGFEKASAGSATTKPPRRQTETIDLPPSFYRHLKGPSQPAGTAPAVLAPSPGNTAPSRSAFNRPVPLAPESSNLDSATANSMNAKSTSATATGVNSIQPGQEAATPVERSSRWANYPKRTLGNTQLDASMNEARQHSLPSGWIPSLPKTPRYGYPNTKPNGP
jgi:hypothetical protein